jgi:hypothetical protein
MLKEGTKTMELTHGHILKGHKHFVPEQLSSWLD